MQWLRPYYHFLVYNKDGGDNMDYQVKYYDLKIKSNQWVNIRLCNNEDLKSKNEEELFTPYIIDYVGHSDVKFLSYKEL